MDGFVVGMFVMNVNVNVKVNVRKGLWQNPIITFSIWGLFSIGKKRWKADDELFPARSSDP